MLLCIAVAAICTVMRTDNHQVEIKFRPDP